MSDLSLILVQHGLAQPPTEGAEPELTAEGRQVVKRVAAWATYAEVQVDRIRHSGKLRAAQTAELLAHALGPPEGIQQVSGLKPMDDVRPVAESFGSENGSSMLVGHMPHLARLAGLLLAGDPESRPIIFRNAGLVCLERDGQEWGLRWALVPDLLP